jgi:hypothetical protein
MILWWAGKSSVLCVPTALTRIRMTGQHSFDSTQQNTIGFAKFRYSRFEGKFICVHAWTFLS